MSTQSLDELIHSKDLIHDWNRIAKSDHNRAWVSIQLKASLMLIKHFFGDTWYHQVLNRISADEGVEEKHPLHDSLWSGKPEDYIRVVHLGLSLKVLQFDNPARGLVAKIPDLCRVSSSFENTYFELKTAATYASAGFEVECLRERKDKKTPDLLVIGTSEQTYVECKKRDPIPLGNISKMANGVLDRLREANTQLKGVEDVGIAWVEVEDGLHHKHKNFDEYIRYIRNEFALLSMIQCVVLCSLNILSAEGVTHHVTTAKGIPNKHVTPTITRELWCNPSQIGVGYPTFIVDLPGRPPLDLPQTLNDVNSA